MEVPVPSKKKQHGGLELRAVQTFLSAIPKDFIADKLANGKRDETGVTKRKTSETSKYLAINIYLIRVSQLFAKNHHFFCFLCQISKVNPISFVPDLLIPWQHARLGALRKPTWQYRNNPICNRNLITSWKGPFSIGYVSLPQGSWNFGKRGSVFRFHVRFCSVWTLFWSEANSILIE